MATKNTPSPVDSARATLDAAKSAATKAAEVLKTRTTAREAAENALRLARESGDHRPALLELVDCQEQEKDAQRAADESAAALAAAGQALAATELEQKRKHLETLRLSLAQDARDVIVDRYIPREIELRREIGKLRIAMERELLSASAGFNEAQILAREIGEPELPFSALDRWRQGQNAISVRVQAALKSSVDQNDPLARLGLEGASCA